MEKDKKWLSNFLTHNDVNPFRIATNCPLPPQAKGVIYTVYLKIKYMNVYIIS